MAATDEPGWKAWYVQAMARSQCLEPADLSDADAASRELVAQVSNQAAWNEATAHRMHLVGHRIERFGETLFVLVLAAAIGWLVLRLANPHLCPHGHHCRSAGHRHRQLRHRRHPGFRRDCGSIRAHGRSPAEIVRRLGPDAGQCRRAPGRRPPGGGYHARRCGRLAPARPGPPAQNSRVAVRPSDEGLSPETPAG